MRGAVAEYFIGQVNPNGIESFSPATWNVARVARNELPWVKRERTHNPERVESVPSAFDIQPFQGCEH
jgi:hypothetical protein